jgi:tetratricopeptide (TPR) repeat protein
MNAPARIVLLASVASIVAFGAGCETTDENLQNTPTHLLMKKGQHAERYGRYEEAADYYQQVLARAPGNQRALVSYGTTMLELDEPAKAAIAFNTAVLAEPGKAELVYLLARAEVENGKYDDAFGLLRTYASDNNDATAWMLLAEYALQLDDPDTASQAIARAIELVGDNSATPYLKAADLAERLGNEAEALRRLRQAYGRDPGNDDVDRRLREYGEIPGPSIALEPGN